MKIINQENLHKKELIVFDLDGTLAATKSPIDKEMSSLITQLLEKKKMAVVGGGKYQLFKTQFVNNLTAPKELLQNLFLFPTTATSFYRYQRGWKNVYAHELSKEERDRIKKTIKLVLKEIGYKEPKQTYGKVIEDRKTQVTFSALGQEVVSMLGEKKGVALKEKWTKENSEVKMAIANLLSKRLPDLEVRAAGFTSIDITKKGIDKAYGLKQIEIHLGIKIKDMLFVGDAIFPGGNDYAITKTKVDYVPIEGPEGTKAVIRSVLTQGK